MPGFELFKELYLMHGFDCGWLFRPDQPNCVASGHAFANKIGGNGSAGSTQATLAMHSDGELVRTACVDELNNCFRLLKAWSQAVFDRCAQEFKTGRFKNCGVTRKVQQTDDSSDSSLMKHRQLVVVCVQASAEIHSPFSRDVRHRHAGKDSVNGPPYQIVNFVSHFLNWMCCCNRSQLCEERDRRM